MKALTIPTNDNTEELKIKKEQLIKMKLSMRGVDNQVLEANKKNSELREEIMILKNEFHKEIRL